MKLIAPPGQSAFGVLLLFAVVFLSLASEGYQGNPGNSKDNHLTIVAVGDIMMGTTYPMDILPPDDGKEIFKPVQAELRDGDLAFGNLEGSLCDEGKPIKCKVPLSGNCFEFVMPTRYASHLKEANFSVLNIANNHLNYFLLSFSESLDFRLFRIS